MRRTWARLTVFCLALTLAAGCPADAVDAVNPSNAPVAGKKAETHAPESRAIILRAGKPLLPITLGTTATEETKAHARTLADMLRAICGTAPEIVTGDGSGGMVLGTPSDFPALPDAPSFTGGPFGREEYVLRANAAGVWLLGATPLAVRHAMWDFLHRLGVRQYFPGPVWEIVPRRSDAALAVDVREKPAFLARRIWYNWGTMPYNRAPYALWCERNRMAQGFTLNSGHAYSAIYYAKKAEFDRHPEYFALVNGTRKTHAEAKFCVSNPGLRALVAEYAKEAFRKQPTPDSISLDPSDGAEWCECAPCAALGTESDRALILANEAAKAANADGASDRYVGMYAYNRHCAPPTIAADPHVIVSAATAFMTGGNTLEGILKGWSEKGATMGVYDYYSVLAWDWNMPRAARAGRVAGLSGSLRHYHHLGARFIDCESGDAWGPYGLGFYVASRVMWKLEEGDRLPALVDDFLAHAFPGAEEPMRAFYTLLNLEEGRRPSSDLLGRLYRALAEARVLAGENGPVRARLDHLLCYLRYADLRGHAANLSGSGADKARDAFVSHAWRMRESMMVHTLGIWSRTVGQRAALAPGHPLQDERPFTAEELDGWLAEGIARHRPVEVTFQPVTFSDDLIPAREPLGLAAIRPGSYPTVPQDHHNYLVWVEKAPAEIALKVTVKHVWNLRPHRITLTAREDATLGIVDESDIVRPDGNTHEVVLKTPHAGLHHLTVKDGGDYTRIAWPVGLRVTIPSGEDTPGLSCQMRGPWTLSFYVPKGTKRIGGWAERIAAWAPRVSGTLVDGGGAVRFDFSSIENGWFDVPVPEGQDGRLWTFVNNHGTRQLMTVPPYLARTAEDLLLPREVVERDTAPSAAPATPAAAPAPAVSASDAGAAISNARAE